MDWLREEFPDGTDFVIIGPKFQTLRRQTMDRVLRARLGLNRDPGEVVVGYNQSAANSKVCF